VTLACACAEEYLCSAISFDYGQRHRNELGASARVAMQLGVRDHRVIPLDLRAIGGSALTADIDVPKDAYVQDAHARGVGVGAGVGVGVGGLCEGSDVPGSAIPITYVPARNLVFLSIALGLAEVVGAHDIFIGANAVDYSGYPDCRPAFIESFERTANLATRDGVEGRPFRVRVPLIDKTKAQIIRLGRELGVDLSLTTSCYDPSVAGESCGHCDSCMIRMRGFAEAGVPDPTRYVGGA
jgi:7-cyano-7-deazaguanine synthase